MKNQGRRTKESVESCPVFHAARILGKKWAILILQELMTPNAKDGLRFNEIHRAINWITPKILTQRLNQLVEQRLVIRIVDDTIVPSSVTYVLTEKGDGLRTTLLSMQEWGRKFADQATECLGVDFHGCHECSERVS